MQWRFCVFTPHYVLIVTVIHWELIDHEFAVLLY